MHDYRAHLGTFFQNYRAKLEKIFEPCKFFLFFYSFFDIFSTKGSIFVFFRLHAIFAKFVQFRLVYTL